MRSFAYTMALVSALAPAIANADCLQKDVAGKSRAYAFGYQSALGGFSVDCALTVNAKGEVKGNCKTSLGVNGPISEGQIDLVNTKTCLFRGSFTMSSIEATITGATLSADKSVLAGTGVIVDGPFMLTAVKTP